MERRQELRVGRVGEYEFRFWECWEPDPRNPQGPERHWFRCASGLEASTAEEMLQKMSGKFVAVPAPELPKSEWKRMVNHDVRVRDKKVQITICERYEYENGPLLDVTVRGPDGLVTSSYEEMLELLGKRPPDLGFQFPGKSEGRPLASGSRPPAKAKKLLPASGSRPPANTENKLSAISSQLSAKTERRPPACGSLPPPAGEQPSVEAALGVSHTGNLIVQRAKQLLLGDGDNLDAAAMRMLHDLPYLGGRPRWVRFGDKDVKVMEYECYTEEDQQHAAVRWFEAEDGTFLASTYKGMLRKLGARPKPRLPEDEHRPAVAAESKERTMEDSTIPAPGDESNGRGTESAFVPETGVSGLLEDAFDLTSESSDEDDLSDSSNSESKTADTPKKTYERPRYLGAYPWALDTRPDEEISDVELDMQTIWEAESLRESDPDLYEAALDSTKRQAYLDRLAEEKKLVHEERLAADLAPRCQFIKADGEVCGSPAMKKRRFCYFHGRTSEERKKSQELELPVLEDDLAIQMAVTNVCRGLLKGSLEAKRASTLLYGLQVASVAVRKPQGAKSRAKE